MRIIAATNKDPLKEVTAKRFREDLYYRLHVIPIEMPPLRERREDIALLSSHFTSEIAAANRKETPTISSEAMKALSDYRWVGNVRELQNVLEQAIVLSDEPVIDLHHLPEAIVGAETGAEFGESKSISEDEIMPFSEIERRAIEHALRVCQKDVTEAARKLQIPEIALREKIRTYQISPD